MSGYFKVLVKGGHGEAYNVGVEDPEISVIELAERAIALGRELFGYKGKIVRSDSSDKEYLVDNPNRRCPIITKARTELGYDPQGDHRRGAAALACCGIRAIARLRRPDESFHHRNRLRRVS